MDRQNRNPLSYVDTLGLAKCTLNFEGGAGVLHCDPNDPDNNDPVTIPVASGNNGGGSNCKNNLGNL
ncbi:hypothetical protein [Hydrocarboniphaga sp.]|uniref:hypothetical protein n=1 Tax=Hydrocarboniphaga sp. TaxID=2033016 RepID=UPI003D097D9F